MIVEIGVPEKTIVKEYLNFKENVTDFIFIIYSHYFKRINDFFRNDVKKPQQPYNGILVVIKNNTNNQNNGSAQECVLKIVRIKFWLKLCF